MKPLCIAPFIGYDWRGNKGSDLSYEGFYRPCCDSRSFNNSDPNFKIPKDASPSSVMKNPLAQEVRKKLLNGEYHDVCYNCRDLSDRGLKAPKDKYNKMLPQIDNSIQWSIEKGNEDGKIFLLDYRPSNLCNFKCRMCSPSNSSLIAAEKKSETHLYDIHRKNSPLIDKLNFEDLILLKIAGGEPLIMDETLFILEKVKNNKKLTIVLLTNLSKMNDDFLQKISQSNNKRIHFQVSIDGTHETYEYIRSGGSWTQLNKNLEILSQIKSKSEISVGITFVTQMWNVFNINKFVDWFKTVDGSLINNKNSYYPKIHITEVIQSYLKPHNLFDDDKKRIIEELHKQSSLFDLQTQKLLIAPLINFLDQNKTRESDLFQLETKRLDQLRGTHLPNVNKQYTAYLK